MYAECFVRGAGGNGATALGYVNALRTRANGATINAGGLTMDFILTRELENCIGKDTEEQIWFVLENSLEVIYGERWSFWRAPTQSFRDLFPIPAVALSSNSKLQQNQDTNNLKINKMKI
jgi:hypothetical protein